MQNVPNPIELRGILAGMDIYILDQLLRGAIAPEMRVLDAGCGMGRNVAYLMRTGFDVSAVDSEKTHIDAVRLQARGYAPNLPAENFRHEAVEGLSFPDDSFDVVICSAVLHFARSDEQFRGMVQQMARVLRPGGLLLARLTTTIGIEDRVHRIEGNVYKLPDGSTRYCPSEVMLFELTAEIGGSLEGPLKTVNVQHQRCMTNWFARL